MITGRESVLGRRDSQDEISWLEYREILRCDDCGSGRYCSEGTRRAPLLEPWVIWT